MFVVMTALFTVLIDGGRYFGKTFYETERFDNEAENLISDISQFVLNAPTEKDLEGALTVTDDEIQNYRNYYGSLAEQIQNIKDQYVDDLEVAEDPEIIDAIEQERDAKIADIKQNFEDDEHVRSKIMAFKKKAIQKELANIESKKKRVLNDYSYFAYKLTNDDTGEIISKGNLEAASVFKKTYSNVGDRSRSYMVDFSEYDSIGAISEIYEIEKTLSGISGVVTIPKSLFEKSDLGRDMNVFTITKYIYYSILLAGIISFILLLTKLRPTSEPFIGDNKWHRLFNELPFDIRVVAALIGILLVLKFNEWFVGMGKSIVYYSEVDIVKFIFSAALSYLSFIALVYIVMWIVQSFKENANLEKLWADTFLSKMKNAAIEMFENRTIGMQSLILLVVIFLGGFGFAVMAMAGDAGVAAFYVFLFVVFFLPALFVFMRRMGYLNRIMRYTEDMANGRLTNDLVVKGKSPLAKHAENLNGLRDGVRNSLNEQAKSERMKTELITNVSHDLRTPLTSIITYTDLLKNPDITEEERAKYIAILDTKSNRLKTLIEDLFEVSKMASGNIEMSKHRIDLAQLLKQAVGEHEEDFTSAKLDLRVNIQEQPIFAYVDGQKWWRVMDNLIVNARKYSLEGTRVYVNLKMNGNNAELTVKNVAKYELNEEASELVERFKRADTSRHTEGSGLGLAIAQSIVDLHGGQMDIAVDGDLFKVTVTVRADN